MRRASNRPIIETPLSRTDVIVEAVAALALAAMWLHFASAWGSLPDRVATHFGITGQPDSWGPKSTLWIIPGSSALLYAVITILSRFVHTFNYPVEITPENAAAQYEIEARKMRWIKMEFLVAIAYLEWKTVQVALGQAQGLGIWILPLMMAVLLCTGIVMQVRARRAR